MGAPKFKTLAEKKAWMKVSQAGGSSKVEPVVEPEVVEEPPVVKKKPKAATKKKTKKKAKKSSEENAGNED
tara:strand:+ start:1867 stop:2079 length:213 start_codon:yes stop_codon:yes gene_type:complete